jgi:hypothetical protein
VAASLATTDPSGDILHSLSGPILSPGISRDTSNPVPRASSAATDLTLLSGETSAPISDLAVTRLGNEDPAVREAVQEETSSSSWKRRVIEG